MTWIIWGCLSGSTVEPIVRPIAWGETQILFGEAEEDDTEWRFNASALLLYSFPAIGVMAIAGLELKQLGFCIRVPNS